jgi:hypothetical protein
MKERLKFAVEVLAVFAICYALQKQIKVLPIIGPYLPGGQ